MDVPMIRESLQAMRGSQRAISTASDRQQEGWRHDVVRGRRDLAHQIGRMSELVGSAPPAQGALLLPFRRALSALRSALAEHQACWPAVSLDPSSEPHRKSVDQVRSKFDALEEALRTLERYPTTPSTE